jgi:hypothetical protein
MKTKSLDVINGLNVASPCKASWNGMTGDDRARFCGLCEKHVYNIAALTTPEVEALIEKTEGEFCARLYRRRDGTVLTADCPVGAAAFSSGRLHRALTYSVIGLWFLTSGALVRSATRRAEAPSWPPTGPSVTFTDWKDWALSVLGMRRIPGPMAAGFIAAPPPLIMGKRVAPTHVLMGSPAAVPLATPGPGLAGDHH